MMVFDSQIILDHYKQQKNLLWCAELGKTTYLKMVVLLLLRATQIRLKLNCPPP